MRFIMRLQDASCIIFLMRLTDQQQKVIRTIAADVIGPGAKLWLFGSRADDAQKGGDVDLYVEVNHLLPDRGIVSSWQRGWSADYPVCR